MPREWVLNPETKEFLYDRERRVDERESRAQKKTCYFLYEFVTTTSPLAKKDGFICVYNDVAEVAEYMEDHRGKTYWDAGGEHKVFALDFELPVGASWEKSNDLIKDELWRLAKSNRQILNNSPIKYNNNFFDVDASSRESLAEAIRLIELGTSLESVVWTDANDNDVLLTKADLKGIEASRIIRKMNIHNASQKIRKIIKDHENPSEIDVEALYSAELGE